MLAWVSANLANIAVAAVLLLIVGLALRRMIRNRKAGKSSCGCDCASCPSCGSCAGCSGCAAKKQ